MAASDEGSGPTPRGRRWTRLGGLLSGGAALWLGLALVLAGALVRVADPPALQALRLQIFDAYQRIAPRESDARPVMIVDIDEQSLRILGQWPWPRTRVAELLDKITQAEPAGVAFDVIFAEPDRASPESLARTLFGVDPRLRQELLALPRNDDVFAAALTRARAVIGHSGVRDDAAQEAPLDSETPPASIAFIGPDPSPFLIEFPERLRATPTLDIAAAGRGLVSLGQERDGVVRRAPAISLADGELTPSLAMELLRVALGETTTIVRSTEQGVAGVIIGDAFAPTDAQGRIWVRYGLYDPNRYVSALDVLRDPDAQARLSGKLVLVGASASGLLDLRATPLYGALPGVEVHAQLLETILEGETLSRPVAALGAELALGVAVGVLVAVAAPWLGPVSTLVLGAVVAAAVSLLSWRLFIADNILLDVSYPLLSALVVFAAVTLANFAREQRERGAIRDAFSRYLAPEVVERLAADPSRLVLGGETRELSILFTDVRNFTTISERLKDDPQRLTRLMNDLLTPLSHAVLERGGTIDKYIGDAIMAFWNAPLDTAAHEEAACRAALDMRVRLAALDAERGAAPEERLDIGVGVNSGPCVVGNLGSDLRFSYSALGDAVNLAARIEGLTRRYGLGVLAGESTAFACADRLALIEIDLIRVKGKQEPQRLFALLGDETLRAAPAFARLQQATARLCAAYRGGDASGLSAALPEAATAAADPSLANAPGGALTTVVALYAERAQALAAAPPPSGWDGVADAIVEKD